MLYELVNFSDQVSALNVFRYITFRSGGATFTALLLMAIGSTMLTIPMVAPKLRAVKVG